MRFERSAGAVVVWDGGIKLEYLLLHYPSGHWDFPKGNVESGESELNTALREVKEETGLKDLEVIFGFRREISYVYAFRGERISKSVVYFLFRTASKDVRLSWEHRGYSWLPYNDALKRLTYENSRKVLAAAHNYYLKLKM